jgi:hypothetical protein
MMEANGRVANCHCLVKGVVPVSGRSASTGVDDCVGNGDLPPEWGIDIVTHGGTLSYGPWADRQR